MWCGSHATLWMMLTRLTPVATLVVSVASLALGILDSVIAQDLTKDPSLIANLALHFLHLLQAWERTAGDYFDSLLKNLSVSMVTGFLNQIKYSLDNLEFWIPHDFINDQTYGFVTVFCISRKTKTRSLKLRLLGKVGKTSIVKR